MKRLLLLTVSALVVMGMVQVMNCSNPLETTDEGNLNPPGPIVIYDTLIDTVYDNDTIYSVDTFYVTDTVTQTDTVVITEPGTGDPQTVCSILLSNLYEIIWMFHNQEGDYLLEFTAEAARDYDFRTLTVDIDGDQFEWKVGENQEFSAEVHLSAYATIRIMTDQPCLQGHEVDICLTISTP